MATRDTLLYSEGHEVLAHIPPASYSSVQVSGWVKVDKHSRVVALIHNGLIAATGTFDAKLQQANTSGGGAAKDIPGKAITQMADTIDNKLRWIELRTDELDITGGFFWVQLSITPATAATIAGAVLLGCSPFYRPVAIHADLAVTN